MQRHRGTALPAALLALGVGAGGALVVAQQSPAPASAAPSAAPAADAPPTVEKFSKEQLEQLVAPIALHPDSLLTQIMMAATYPIEVVQAERWVKANPKLQGAELEAKLKEQDWDPSVKALCTLPDVLDTMSKNLDWTQDLGDAFLGQQDELLDTVQRMRGKAHDSGNLKTSEQQVVTVQQDKIIVIESASPEVVYVPSYSPTVVYGGWSYPSYYYPPMYPYYPPGAGLISFGIGMAVGGAIWGDCDWGWGHNDVNIDVDRYNEFNRSTNVEHRDRSGDRSNWQHDASHRKGVNYQNSKVASQYGGKAGSSRVSRDQARGYSGSGSGTREARTPSGSTRQAGTGQGAAARDRQGTASGGAARDRQGASPSASTRDRASSGGERASASQRSASTSQRSSSASQRSSSYGSGSGRSAYSGSSRPSTDRAASSRGSMSRGSASYGGGGYGGSRGGGMRGGGGGRRR